jgi:hypothetical protein
VTSDPVARTAMVAAETTRSSRFESTHIDAAVGGAHPLLIGTSRASHLTHIASSRTPHVSERLAVRILPDHERVEVALLR